jgi:hypothetical protein
MFESMAGILVLSFIIGFIVLSVVVKKEDDDADL